MRDVVLDAKLLDRGKDKEAPLVVQARAIVISDFESHARAQEFLVRLAELKANREDHYREPKQKAHEAHKAICKAERDDLSVIETARALVEPACLTWTRQQREREEAERKKAEEEERKRLDELAIQEAVALAEAGDEEMAEQLLQEQAQAPAPAVMVPTHRASVAGVGEKASWTADVADLRALCAWLATQPEDVAAEAFPGGPAKSWLNRQAGAMKQHLRIPGLVPRRVEALRVRGR